MKLLNGTDVAVIGHQIIDNIPYLITTLPNVVMTNGALVRYVLLRQHEFQEYVEKIHIESEDLKDLTKQDIIVAQNEEVNDNECMGGGEVSKDDKPSSSEVQGQGEPPL